MLNLTILYDQLDLVKTNLTKLHAKADALRATAAALVAAGITTSRPSYRDNKYLYLVGPMVDGQRTREYIGSDPEKIAAALARVERQTQYDQVKNDLAAIERQVSRIENDLFSLVNSSNPRGQR